MEKSISFYDRKMLPPPLAYVFLFLVYISTFRIFATLPFEQLHQNISTISILILSLFYLLSLSGNISRKKITLMDMLMLILILLCFLSAYQGRVVFGQPFIYGLIAQRSVLLSLSGIVLISFLKNGWISMRQVEKSFLVVSLSLLAIYYYFFLFVNPSHITSNEFVTYSPIRGYRYTFQLALVIMLLFYSLFKLSLEKKRRYLIVVLLILFYLVYFLQSRTTIVVLAITLLIYFYKNFSVRRRIKNILIYGSGLAVITLVSVSLGYTGLFTKYDLLFHNVLGAFLNDTPGDASSAMRFIEFNTAIKYIFMNPILGNGFISNQWNGGWQGIMGYFYPADIGILGNIFVYGIIGTFIIYLPYILAMRMTKKIQSEDVFYKACKYMLLFYFLSMFISAVNIRDLSSIMFLVCLIYYFRYYIYPVENFEEQESLIPAII